MTFILLSSSIYEEKKSKFLGFLFEISTECDVKLAYESIFNDHKKASHVCYGGILNGDVYLRNDSEVGQPSRVMMNILKHKEMNNHLFVCVRYFGGVKLGVGGVSKAFKSACNLCIDKI